MTPDFEPPGDLDAGRSYADFLAARERYYASLRVATEVRNLERTFALPTTTERPSEAPLGEPHIRPRQP